MAFSKKLSKLLQRRSRSFKPEKSEEESKKVQEKWNEISKQSIFRKRKQNRKKYDKEKYGDEIKGKIMKKTNK